MSSAARSPQTTHAGTYARATAHKAVVRLLADPFDSPIAKISRMEIPIQEGRYAHRGGMDGFEKRCRCRSFYPGHRRDDRLSRNTVRRALRQKTRHAFTPPKRNSKLEEFKGYIEKRHNECAVSGLRLLGEIQGMGCEGAVDTVRRYCAI